jgi:hypothetical protein
LTLLLVDQPEQQRYHQRIDHDGDKDVFDALFNIPASLHVGVTGIPRVNPCKEGRAKRFFPECNYTDGQEQSEDDEEYDYL